MDWVYMAPDLPGDMLVTQDQLGYSVGDEYRVDPEAVASLQVFRLLLHLLFYTYYLLFYVKTYRRELVKIGSDHK